ncbi:MAG: SbcC/MukB-like Walker B domain-containing protein [Burkholderiaceae bacterium]
MKLDRLILVNWGQMSPGDYDMGDLTLLTGETGSGKSTMLDGLQTVMTAGFRGILNYNPGQEEVSQGQRSGKSKRTIESYVVGAEYSKFSRPDGAQGYMAAVFQPDPDEEQAKTFTAVVAASARVEGAGEIRHAKQESFLLFIADNAALTFEDFMEDVETRHCVAVEHIGRRLKTKYPKLVEFHEKKRDYLCALYGRFRGKNGVPWEEASQAAKAWVQSIAYRPIGSVHELVRDEILDFDGKQLQQDIERISGLMRQVAKLREEGRRLTDSVERLDTLAGVLDQTAIAHEQHVQQEFLVAKLQLKLDKEAVQDHHDAVTQAMQKKAELSSRIEGRTSRKTNLDEHRLRLRAQLMGVPAHVQKEDYEAQERGAIGNARRILGELRTSLIAAALLDDRAKEIISTPNLPGFDGVNAAVDSVAQAHATAHLDGLGDLLTQVGQAAANEVLNPEQLLMFSWAFGPDINAGLSAMHEAMLGTRRGSLWTELVEEQIRLTTKMNDAAALQKDLAAQKARLVRGGVTYPPAVELALGRIRELMPEANPQVLCDLVEPLSEKWQPAIEGYMGGARYNLVVDTEWEARVLDHARTNNWRGVNIIQGSLCLRDAQRMSLPVDSIVHELKCSNKIVYAYLVAHFGTVLKVTSAEELRFTSRGLTQDGKGSGSRTMFITDVKALVFGQEARRRQLEMVTAELEAAGEVAGQLVSTKEQLNKLQLLLGGLKEPRLEARPLEELARAISDARNGLSALDLSEVKDLEGALKDVQKEIEQLDNASNEDRQIIFGLNRCIEDGNAAIKDIEGKRTARLDAVDRGIARIKALAEANPQLTFVVISDAVEARLAEDLSLDTEIDSADKFSRRPPIQLGQSREALAEYYQRARTDERFPQTLPYLQETDDFARAYRDVVAMCQAVAQRRDALRGIGLVNNKAELEQAVSSFNDVFTKQFCVEIKSKVDDGIRTLRQMNNELRNLKFGADRFSIDWSKWEPEFADYLEFFEAVTRLTESTEVLDLFGENELSGKHQEIRDRLVKLLLDDEQERATRELLRIADYRNYRRYDIFNDSDSGGRIRLSQWGTGSGGQLETPAYIVRAAVVTNRLKLFEKGPSLKMLANDESFSKMDEARARAVLSFLRDNLNLQVISAMPTMKAGAIKDEFNREYSFTRLSPVENGELDFMSECDERVFKTDKMRELWERQRQAAREKARQLFDEAEPEEVPHPAPPESQVSPFLVTGTPA